MRHGETAWNAERRSQGLSDVPLSAIGRAQAAAVARALAGEPLMAVYSSALARARETAAAIAAYHNLVVQVEPDLRELDQGDLEGLTGDEMRARYGPLLARWREDPTTVQLPNGETIVQLAARACAALDRVRTRHGATSGSVALVAHNFTNRVLICALLGLSLARVRAVPQEVAACTVFELWGPVARLVALNSTAHLREND